MCRCVLEKIRGGDDLKEREGCVKEKAEEN